MKLSGIFLMILFCGGVGCAQTPWPEEKDDQQQQAVSNEDGGRSYLVLPADGPLVSMLKPGASNISELEQHSIFVGSGWAEPSLRARETRLGKLLSSIRDHAQTDDLAAAGINNLYAPTWVIERSDIAGNRSISDLEVQGILSEALRNGPTPTAESIYVIYLDPTIHSTLGSLMAEKHYMAYHGFFNYSSTRVHYAVVPFTADSEAGFQVALRTFIVAALHSN
jgi:hypothetical protein